jgi:Chromo (CHRromatin Organisation MOdifier) domain
MRVHPVFHVSLLKPYSGVPTNPPSPIVVDGEEEYVVQKIIRHRKPKGRRQYLVRWEGYDHASDEWIDEVDL